MEKVKNITDIVCLTIPPREKYFKSLVSKLTSQEFKVEAFQGVIGNDLNRSRISSLYSKLLFSNINIPLTKRTRLAIAISHILIWEKIKDLGRGILILEDDVIAPLNLKDSLEQIIEENPFEWDILFLGYSGKLKGLTKDNYLLASPGNFPDTNHGMFAYLVNPNSVKKLIRLCTPIRRVQHIDWLIRSKYSLSSDKNRISAVYYVPNLIRHNNSIKSENR
jgi:GR25 family glycosyltransferase involved in LPS biosynthesis